MHLILAILVLVCSVSACSEEQHYGASSQQQKAGPPVTVVDSGSSDSSSDNSGDGSQDNGPVVPPPRPVVQPKPIIRLPPVKGWVKASATAASNSNDGSYQDTADDSGADGSAAGGDTQAQLLPATSQQQTYHKSAQSSHSVSAGHKQIQVNVAATGDQQQGPVGGGPIITGVVYPPIEEGGIAPPQVPGVWDALDDLRGKPALGVEEIQDLLAAAQPDTDYPIIAEIPDQISFNCANVKQAGYYADTDFRCQVFRRCDTEGVETSYLCPNLTLFNQITLVCDWFYNVNCANSAKYQDYSNSRLYHADWVLFDTPPEKEGVDQSQVSAVLAANAGHPGKQQTHHAGSSHSQHQSSSSHSHRSNGQQQSAQLQAANVQQVPY